MVLSRFLALALISWPRLGTACSPPACLPAFVAPSLATAVPGNAPAFFVTQSISLIDPSRHGVPAELALSDGAGNPVAIDVVVEDGSQLVRGIAVDDLIKPRAPLAPGGYSLSYVDYCLAPSPMPKAMAITVGADSPLPAAIGEVQVQNGVAGVETPTSAGSCFVTIQAAIATISVSGPAEWSQLTRYRLEVDGKIWSASPYGQGIRPVYASCGTLPQGASPGLAPGAHQGTLSMHLAGTTQDPPSVPVNFTLSCPAVSNGCSMAGGGLGAGPLWLLAFALILRRRLTCASAPPSQYSGDADCLSPRSAAQLPRAERADLRR